MTIEEAIKHEEDIAEKQEELYGLCPASESEFSHCDGIKDCKAVKNGENKGCLKCAKEYRQLAEWLKELKQFREQTKWIPVSERLPEESIAVLVWCPERKNTYCAYLEERQWWIFGAYFQKVKLEIKAWMPLPQPYKSESEG